MTKSGIPPVTFKRIATAMGFSPMAKANLAEVHRIAQRCDALTTSELYGRSLNFTASE